MQSKKLNIKLQLLILFFWKMFAMWFQILVFSRELNCLDKFKNSFMETLEVLFDVEIW